MDPVSITFGLNVRLQSYPRPSTSTSSWFLLRTYSVRDVNFICLCCSQFSSLVLRPGTSACFIFLKLSQFYGSWNPRAPVFIVSLFLFAHAETQWCITVYVHGKRQDPTDSRLEQGWGLWLCFCRVQANQNKKGE